MLPFSAADSAGAGSGCGFAVRLPMFVHSNLTKELALDSDNLLSFLLQIAQKQALVAVPLFELFGNAAKFGAVAASLPAALSRLRLTLMSDAGKPV